MFPILNSFHLIPINPCQVLLATVQGSGGSPHLSTVTLQKSILLFYSQCKLFPSGVVAEMESVQKWARKCGKAIKRLVPPHMFAIKLLVLVYLFGFFCLVDRYLFDIFWLVAR